MYYVFENQIVFGFELYLWVEDLDCIYERNLFEYLDLDFIYGLCQYLNLDLQAMHFCQPLHFSELTQYILDVQSL